MKANFITTDRGKKMSAILPIKEYEKLLEELHDIKLYDKAKDDKSESIQAVDAFKLLDAKRSGVKKE